jgi:hypothetical protein
VIKETLPGLLQALDGVLALVIYDSDRKELDLRTSIRMRTALFAAWKAGGDW